MNPARIAALRLGMGDAMPAFTVQINCGSGMQSIDTAYQYIREGHSDLILAGGAEALSHAPLVFSRSAVNWYARLNGARDTWSKLMAALGFRPSFLTPVIGLERGLTDPITDLNMGQTAELVAHLFHITRRQADEYAAESQNRLARAQVGGYLKDEIEPAFARDGKEKPPMVAPGQGERVGSSSRRRAGVRVLPVEITAAPPSPAVESFRRCR